MIPPTDKETCWSLIRGAANGTSGARELFAKRYLPVVRTYLSARWSSSAFSAEIDDVVQEVFVACFRDGGALANVRSDHASGFRAFLHGVTRNVALDAERRRARRVRRFADGSTAIERTPVDEATLSRIFDRAYAESVMLQAREVMEERARATGEPGQRRVELLRLRFEEGLPVRTIAERWGEDPAQLHREQSKAFAEFRGALAEVVSESERYSAERVAEECQRLLHLLRA